MPATIYPIIGESPIRRVRRPNASAATRAAVRVKIRSRLWGIVLLLGNKPVATRMLDSQFYATRALASSDGMRTQNRPTREGANVTIAKQLEPENRTRCKGLQPFKVDEGWPPPSPRLPPFAKGFGGQVG